MRRSTDRILTTHAGSLPRPADLEAAVCTMLEGGETDAAPRQALIEQATREVVQHQVECGVDIVSDGEVGKTSYSTYVSERLDGFGASPGP